MGGLPESHRWGAAGEADSQNSKAIGPRLFSQKHQHPCTSRQEGQGSTAPNPPVPQISPARSLIRAVTPPGWAPSLSLDTDAGRSRTCCFRPVGWGLAPLTVVPPPALSPGGIRELFSAGRERMSSFHVLLFGSLHFPSCSQLNLCGKHYSFSFFLKAC